MSIVIDVRNQHADNTYRGVGVYTRLLFKALEKQQQNITIIEKGVLPDFVELIHYPYFDLFFRTLKPLDDIPFIVTVHDVIPLVYANHYWPGFKGSITQIFQTQTLKKAKAILTDSLTSKEDIHTLLQIPKEKIEVVYLAADPELRRPTDDGIAKVKKEYGIDKPYLLYVGDINYNKNIPALLRSFAKMRNDNYDLVLVSRALQYKDIPEAKEILEILKHNKLSARVKILTNVPVEPKNVLASLYAGATWYVQPSLYEGFGLPVLEAMQCGVPVISSTGGSLKEIVDERCAVIFQPESEEQIVLALKKALNLNQNEREALVLEGLKRAAAFSWEKVARHTAKVYHRVLNGV